MATKRKCEEENNVAELSHKADGPSSDIHTSYQYEYSQKDESQSQEYYFAQYYEQRGDWAAFFDWNTSCYFYQNTTDFTVQWEQPDEWTSLPPKYIPISDLGSSVNPNNSFETGSQTINYVTEGCLRRNARDIEAKNSEYLQRPSKRQTDPEESKKVHWIPEGATEYNIWYDRWVGEQWRRERDSGPAETRCVVKTDAGYTKANVGGAENCFFCIYFARGCCYQGPECGFLHLVPSNDDEKRIDLSHDVFGRERHRSHKDDMGGVGAYDSDCRTLYIGGLGSYKDLETVLWEEFGEFGEIEDIRVIPKRHIAFVRYRNRVNAEFAKIAMADQKLGNREVLNVRWAFDDPAPASMRREANIKKQRLLSAAESRGLLNMQTVQPVSSNTVTAPYPNTDHQYPVQTPVQCGPMTREQVEQGKILEQVKTDCDRLDQVLKTIESTHARV